MLDVYNYHALPETLDGYDSNWMMGALNRFNILKRVNYFRRNESDILDYEAIRVGDHIEVLEGDHVVGRIDREGDSYVLTRGVQVNNRVKRKDLASTDVWIGFMRAIAGSRW